MPADRRNVTKPKVAQKLDSEEKAKKYTAPASAASFTRAPHYFTPSFTYSVDEYKQLFPNIAKAL